MSVSILAGLLSGLIFLAAIQVVARISSSSPVAVYFGTALVVHVLSVAGAALAVDIAYWQMAAVYWFAFMAYLFVFGALYKSISLLILQRVYRHAGHAMPMDEVTKGIVLTSFTGRIVVMQETGLLEEGPDGYRLSIAGQKTASKINKIQNLFCIDKCGLYEH